MSEFISLGAGVQSSTMALMAARGLITPMPLGAIFADTQDEPPSVYAWLPWLEAQLPFPIYYVSRGKLSTESLRVRTSKTGNTYVKHSIPAFVANNDGTVGIQRRQCTSDFKIEMIQRKLRTLIGRDANTTQWIGISLDEVHRIKPSRKKWIFNRYPLIEHRMTRHDCLTWMVAQKFPTPPRSACVFCPYHSDMEWARLKREEPAAFTHAVEHELALQHAYASVPSFKGRPYLHRGLKLLSQTDFETKTTEGQQHPFGNECEGVCGV